MTAPTRASRTTLLATLAIIMATTLAGCGLLVVGGTAATTAVVATDRRTTGEQVEDKAIEMKVGAEMRKLFADKARVNTVSYAGRVLLLGDVPNQQDKASAEQAARGVEKVKQVFNELRVGDLTPLSVRTNDTWLTTKVTTALVNTKDVPTRTIVVTTERGIVYLMGKVTEAEGQMAAKAAAGVTGVNKVVKLFEIVARESILLGGQPAAPIEPNASMSPASPAAPDAGETQTLPVQ